MKTFSVIKQNYEHGSRVREILNLPDDAWSDVQIHFGTGEIGTAQVTFLLTGEQTIALAELAFTKNTFGDCADDDAGYAHSDPPEVT